MTSCTTFCTVLQDSFARAMGGDVAECKLFAAKLRCMKRTHPKLYSTREKF